MVYIDQSIADRVIEIRQRKKIKLPDAIIAATALENRCDFVTRNSADFKNIDPNLHVINPFLPDISVSDGADTAEGRTEDAEAQGVG